MKNRALSLARAAVEEDVFFITIESGGRYPRV